MTIDRHLLRCHPALLVTFHAVRGETRMADVRNTADQGELPAGRRSRQQARRLRRVEFSLTDDEYAELSGAAARRGLARGAYAAEAALAAARGAAPPADSALRELLGEFLRAAGLVRRIGVNL